jgi:hypothetical protein
MRRQRREVAAALEEQRLQHVKENAQQKMARVEQVAQQKASLRAALEQLRSDIAHQEEDFKRALSDMQVQRW